MFSNYIKVQVYIILYTPIVAYYGKQLNLYIVKNI